MILESHQSLLPITTYIEMIHTGDTCGYWGSVDAFGGVPSPQSRNQTKELVKKE